MNAPEEWWKTFFNGLVVDFWRAAMPPEATTAEADFLARHLALAPGARVLDVACGDGRLALELARRGFRLTGVDISEDFLAAGRRSAGAPEIKVSRSTGVCRTCATCRGVKTSTGPSAQARASVFWETRATATLSRRSPGR